MLRFYEIADTIDQEVNQFEEDIKDFVAGTINPIKFKAIRVAHGIYEQRQEHTYMIRIRCAAGGITPVQLKKCSELGEQYGSGEVHFTTRREVQLHNVLIQDIVTVIRELLTVGLSTRGGGGNTIRNILTSPNSGVDKEDIFDVDPYAIELTSRMVKEPDSWNLPRKFKIAFSNNSKDTAYTQATCLGFVATKKEDQDGFEVYCAGGMGAKPMVGHLLMDFVPAEKAYQVTKALKVMFDKHGNRRSKFSNRLKFLWKKLQREEFVSLFLEEYNKISSDKNLDLKIVDLDNKPKIDASVKVDAPKDDKFDIWKERYCLAQKQEGLYCIKIPLQLGDLVSNDGLSLTKLVELFGENTIRCDRAQNIRLRNIPEAYLGNIYNCVSSFERSLVEHASFIGNMINCTGAQTCKLGICLPRGLSVAIRDKLVSSNLDLDRLADFRLNMSGCPNTCGLHHIADLGFFGKVARKEGQMYPAYYVLAGARVAAGETKYAEKLNEIASHHIPNFVHDFLQAYLINAEEYKNYQDYLEDEGKDVIKSLCEKYSNVPLFSEDESFYIDFGATRKLSLDEMGSAECSAGMFDMIDVDRKVIRRELKQLDAGTGTLEESLYNITFSSTRMLLVTRGLDVKRDEQAFQSFDKHFVETDLISKEFRSVVQLGELVAKGELDKSVLTGKKSEIIGLSSAVNELYTNMDDSLRFKKETVVSVDKKEEAELVEKDYRGVACPMNFVKTKLVLEMIASGQKLQILLDDGEPIENVPNSVKLEGHKILEQIKTPDGHWQVLIQKK